MIGPREGPGTGLAPSFYAFKDRPLDAVSGRESWRLPRMASGWGKLLEIEDRIFTEQRLLVCGFTVAVSYAIGLAWLMLQHGWFLGSETKPCMDFAWMWGSGAFAGSNDPTRVYEVPAFSPAWKTLTGLSISCPLIHTHFNYPPTYLFITYLLSLMPYSTAYLVWMAATLLLYLAAVYMVIPRLAAIIVALTPFPIILIVLLGHNAFMTAGLIGLSLVFLERRPWLAGILLGLVSYKPQFGILFPIALLASRDWRALAGATATTVALGLAAAIAFGYQGWPYFIASLYGRDSSLLPGGGIQNQIQSIYGVLQWAGAPAWISWTLHLIVAVIVTVLVSAAWARPVAYPLKAAILCIGSVAVTPYVIAYDLLILSIAVAFLVNDGLARGFLPGERTAILIGLIGLVSIFMPLDWIIYLALFLLIARRTVVGRDETLNAAVPSGCRQPA